MPCSKIVPIQRRSTFSSIYENLQNCFKSLNNQGLIVSVETGSFVPLWFYDRSHEGSQANLIKNEVIFTLLIYGFQFVGWLTGSRGLASQVNEAEFELSVSIFHQFGSLLYW